MITWVQDGVDWVTGYERIEVQSGQFAANLNTRFSGMKIVVYAEPGGSGGKMIFVPSDIRDIHIVDKGFLHRVFDKSSKWFDAVFVSAAHSTILPIIDQLTPDIVPGQRFVVTWLNGVLGSAVTAKRLLSSSELVEFQVSFRDGRELRAKTEVRFLLRRLPSYYASIAREQGNKTLALASLKSASAAIPKAM